jgi:hypothetical protein
VKRRPTSCSSKKRRSKPGDGAAGHSLCERTLQLFVSCRMTRPVVVAPQ